MVTHNTSEFSRVASLSVEDWELNDAAGSAAYAELPARVEDSSSEGFTDKLKSGARANKGSRQT